jgi:hypothetical protein
MAGVLERLWKECAAAFTVPEFACKDRNTTKKVSSRSPEPVCDRIPCIVYIVHILTDISLLLLTYSQFALGPLFLNFTIQCYEVTLGNDVRNLTCVAQTCM